MRVLAYILALMTLVLSAAPCCMLEDHPDSIWQESPESASAPGEDCPESKGPCSPFYACGACPGCIEAAANEWAMVAHPTTRMQISILQPESEPKSLVRRLFRPPIAEFS